MAHSSWLANCLKGYENETIIYFSCFLCWFIIYFPNWWETIFSINFFIKDLPKPKIVCSMYPQRVGKNASYTKICCDLGFLPTSVGQFPAHSAGWLIRYPACCTNRSGPPGHTANCSKPPSRPPIRFLQLSQYSVKHFQARSTKNSLCNINHHTLNYSFYKINGLLQCEYINISIFYSIFAVQCYFPWTVLLFDMPLLRKLVIIRLQFCPAVGNTACGGGERGKPWVYMEHELGGDK
jgi:hypothetical protein